MPKAKFSPSDYSVRYAEAHESILKTVGWKKSSHRYWALDVGPVRGSVRVQGEIHRRDRNSVALYAPGVRYEENIEIGSLVSWAWLLIEERAEPSLLWQLTGEKGFCFFIDPAQTIRNEIRYFVEAAERKGPQKVFLTTAHLYLILGSLFSLKAALQGGEKDAAKVAGRKNWVHPWRKAVWDALEQTLAGSVSATQLAATLGVSVSKLTHGYRERCGESLHETLTGWRLEKACALLSGSALSIKQVANRIGLSHQSYLSNFLKKELGLTPSEYRQMTKVSDGAGIRK